jgi:hypothetical protein
MLRYILSYRLYICLCVRGDGLGEFSFCRKTFTELFIQWQFVRQSIGQLSQLIVCENSAGRNDRRRVHGGQRFASSQSAPRLRNSRNVTPDTGSRSIASQFLPSMCQKQRSASGSHRTQLGSSCCRCHGSSDASLLSVWRRGQCCQQNAIDRRRSVCVRACGVRMFMARTCHGW